MKKKICFIWITAQVCLFVMVFIVHAQTCVGGGVLTINSVPVSESFGSTNVDVYDQELIHIFSDFVQFEDSRAVAQSFTLYVSVTNFDAISVENISIISDEDNVIDYNAECDNADGITLQHTSFSSFVDTDNDGVSDNKALVIGDDRTRVGNYSIKPKIKLVVPGSLLAGSYSSTLTFSII